MVLTCVFGLVYLILASNTVFSYRDEVIKDWRWYEKLQDWITGDDSVSQPRRAVGIVLLLTLWGITLITLFAIAPLLWFLIRSNRNRKHTQRIKERDAQWAAEEKAEKNRKEEEAGRAEARKQFFKEYPPRLYFHTICGVTAVMREADYLAATVRREREEDNKSSSRAAKALLSPSTFTFVNEPGAALVNSKTRFEDIARYKIAGSFSDLQTFVKKHKIELIQDKDIFVPWISGALIPLQVQIDMISNCNGRDLYNELLVKQAPRKLQPREIA